MRYRQEDSALYKKVRKGDIHAFEILFKRYYGKLCVFAEDYVKEPAIAEEIASGLFMGIWEKREKISINISVKAYLYRSIHNDCMQYLEKLRSFRRYEDFAGAMIRAREIRDVSGEYYPIANLISKEVEDEIEAALNALPDKCREIFLLHRFEELSYEEISRKLGISINTVRTQMMRAMQKLRESLKEYLPLSSKIKRK